MNFSGDQDSEYSHLSIGVQQLSLRQINPNHGYNTKKPHSRSKKHGKSSEAAHPIETPLDRIKLKTDSDAHLAVLKNENYHLKLELTQQRQEVDNLLKRLKTSEASVEIDAPQWPVSNSKTSVLVSPNEINDENDSPTRSHHPSLSEYDIVTHFSGSPYKGELISSPQDIASRASSSITHLRRNSRFFKNSVIPFLQKTLDTFQHSEVFNEDAHVLRRNLDAFKAHSSTDKDAKVQLMINILDGINHLQQQCIAVLNRELENKHISHRLEYLFTVFLDPEQYGLVRKDYSDTLKKELLDLMLDLLASKGESASPKNQKTQLKQTGKRDISMVGHTKSTTGSKIDIKSQIEKVPALPPTPKLAKRGSVKPKKALASSPRGPQSRSLSSAVLPSLPQAKHDNVQERLLEMRQAHKFKGSSTQTTNSQWEFIPIGYDESMLLRQTPDRRLRLNQKRNEILQRTPLAMTFKDEGEAEADFDPLQAYFTEFSGDTLDQDESTAEGHQLTKQRV
ncbi:LAME_0C05072g1_1 [Lachancea meyersii CBS 8951]|uniref:LAME_0C05072g1_1 n=1 Tax=Lachancea meyersii CBS 8951 TaxID=1266667 RepID=A0A1G4J1E7_9SACH|nr:LAME_0C05072g1_1 [Lachancea meyersii CBS 8951]